MDESLLDAMYADVVDYLDHFPYAVGLGIDGVTYERFENDPGAAWERISVAAPGHCEHVFTLCAYCLDSWGIDWILQIATR